MLYPLPNPLYRPIKNSTFESTTIDGVTAKVVGTINDEEIELSFDDEEKFGTAIKAIKALFSQGETDSFLSALQWVHDFILKKDNPNGEGRIPLEVDEVESLQFSYTEEKERGTNERPAVSWEALSKKYEVASLFDYVTKVQRKRPQTEKEEIRLW